MTARSVGELQDGVPDAFGEFGVVSFSRYRKDGRAQMNLEVESPAADERAGGRFQHIKGTPVVRQTIDVKRDNGSSGFTSCHGDAGAPWPLHLCLEISVGGGRRKNAEDRLLPPESFRISEEVDHGFGGLTLPNWENDTIGITHEAKEMFQHPFRRIGLRYELRKT